MDRLFCLVLNFYPDPGAEVTRSRGLIKKLQFSKCDKTQCVQITKPDAYLLLTANCWAGISPFYLRMLWAFTKGLSWELFDRCFHQGFIGQPDLDGVM